MRATERDVAFTCCAPDTCSGEIDGAAFRILMPEQWNGTLLLWSHGIRPPFPLPPDGAAVNHDPEAGPGWTPEDPGPVVADLLESGFALAGSAYRSNGWAVADAVTDQTALYRHFVDVVGAPDRTIVWGASLGGLVTALLAERESEWVDGAAPLCGVLGGGVDNLDLALDVTYAIRELLAPGMQLTGFTSWRDARRVWQRGYDAVVSAGSDLRRGVPAIVLVAALVDAPSQTRTYDGSTLESRVRAYGEGAVNALTYGTLFRWDIENRFSGNPSDNTGTDYAARISGAERDLVDTIGGPGTTQRLLRRLETGERVAADPQARDRLAESSTPTGAITDPMLTVHTAADPLVIAQNSTLYAERVTANPDRTADLVQALTVAPASFPQSSGAPYGAGHCNFTGRTFTGVAELVDAWVRDGRYPEPSQIEDALGENSGYVPGISAGSWPADLRR